MQEDTHYICSIHSYYVYTESDWLIIPILLMPAVQPLCGSAYHRLQSLPSQILEASSALCTGQTWTNRTTLLHLREGVQ